MKWIRRLLDRRRVSDTWLYFCLAISWALIFGGVSLMIWGDPRWGFVAIAAGLFVVVFEVGVLMFGLSAWFGMRLGVERAKAAERLREAKRSGRLP